MDPKIPKEDLFRVFLYDYLKKRGFSQTAKTLRNEAQITARTSSQFNRPYDPYGFLYEFWVSFYDLYQAWIIPGLSRKSDQATNVGALIDSIPQIIRERYSIRCLSRCSSKQTLLSCDFSSDGMIVASGGIGMKPFLCYAETCDAVTTSESHSSTILDVRFQPESNLFATASADKTVKLWNARRPATVLYDFVGHNWIVKSLDFHPTEGILCSSDTHGVIEEWNLDRRVRMNTFKAGGSLVRFQPGSGRILASVNRNVITLRDFKTWTVEKRFQGHVKDIRSICWDVTGQTIASVSEDEVRVWTINMEGKCLYEYPSKGKRFQTVIFHPRFRNVLVVGGFQNLELLILDTGETRSITASDLSITGLAACTESKLIASAGNDSMVKIWK
ncbi:transcriptional corepressor LEUNIG-like [Cicer arietinum]|uniref:Transcriptional corepressor LEUNIG-like n=1 Tax=Cicer arietinum TaxID=3827 RepID=A0A1S2YJ70_CICAR|nr:transcriptional corepressor LEUNIG-like [Cicer arietinum]